ncbi:MAG: Hsp20/alpha crystallin family protein [Chloroflexota bacterium]|nr:Hsp20/alpha crystallin family protein [Chloroflexota bacterium]
MTTMIRWNPLREMVAMQNALERMNGEQWRTIRPAAESFRLALDVYEQDDAYQVVASLPGVGADNIAVNWHDDVLTISAELPALTLEGENVRAHMNERTTGKFSRTLRFNRPVDANAVEATYVDGVLTLRLPKTAEAQPKVIPVRSTATISAN